MSKILKLSLAVILTAVALYFFVGGGDKAATEYVEDYMGTDSTEIMIKKDDFLDTLKVDTNEVH